MDKVDRHISVLIVDDQRASRHIVRGQLAQLGFSTIEEAADGVEALEKLRSKSFGLVISDWNMDGMDGLDLLRALRDDAALHTIPFIMVTSQSQPQKRELAKSAGVNGYIIKPVDVHTLASKIAKAFEAMLERSAV